MHKGRDAAHSMDREERSDGEDVDDVPWPHVPHVAGISRRPLASEFQGKRRFQKHWISYRRWRWNEPAHSDELVARCVVARLASLQFEPDAAVLTLGKDTAVAARLVAQGLNVESFVIEDGARDPRFLGMELDAVRERIAVFVLDKVLDSVDDPSKLLAIAYSVLRPGGLLVATVSDPRIQEEKRKTETSTSTSGSASAGRTSRDDSVRSLIYREGFESSRYWKRTGRTRIVVARRSSGPPPRSRVQRVSVIVPVYNEAKTFPVVMNKLLAKQIPSVEIDVVIVESNSNDGSRELAIEYSRQPGVSLILEDVARGKGHAVRAGLARAEGDFVLIQDADLEYDIDDYEVLLAPLVAFETGLVLGARSRTRGANWGVRYFESAAVASRIMNLGNAVFVAMFNLIYQQRLQDPFTMAKVFRRECVSGIELECNRFDFDWELLGKLIRTGCTPIEVPISYRSRSFAEGKKIRVIRDPFTWVIACVKYRFTRLEG